MTVTVPQIDVVTKEVSGKLDFFEKKIGTLTNDVNKALDAMNNIQVDPVAPPTNLAKPSESGYEPLSNLKVPELEAKLPQPPVINLNIQSPEKMNVPSFEGLNIDIPEAPIFSEDLSAPDFIDASVIPEVNTDIVLPVAPNFVIQNLDIGELPQQINLSDLLQDLDLSDLDLPATPEAPILN